MSGAWATYEVPSDATVHECRVCGRPFPAETDVTLHLGLEHADVTTDAEITAFSEAYTEESEALRVFRLKVVVLVVLAYFGFLFLFSIFG